MTYKLLMVDDEPANLRLLERLFRHDYNCLTASSGEAAIELLSQHDVAILITDQRMPQMSGIELLKRTAKLRPHMARILLTGYTDVEALVESINCGLVHRYLTKPWNNDELKIEVSRALEQYENNKSRHALQVANDRLQMRLKEMKLGIANALEALLRANDEYSFLHASRVATHATKLAEAMGAGEEEREDLAIAAALHHLGDLGARNEASTVEVSSEVEWAINEAPSDRGARILTIVPELRNVADLVRFHCENFNGSGFPRGLQGDQIPLSCRIIRLADEYDLLTQARATLTQMSHDEAMRSLQERAGTDFDPRVVNAMWQLYPQQADSSAQSDFDDNWRRNLLRDVDPELGEAPYSVIA